MKNKILALLACLLSLVALAAPVSAHCTLTCPVVGGCCATAPDLPTGWWFCTQAELNSPPAGQALFFSQTNYGGYCYTTNMTNTGIADLPERDMTVGSIKNRRANSNFVRTWVYNAVNYGGSRWTVPNGDTPVVGAGAGETAWTKAIWLNNVF